MRNGLLAERKRLVDRLKQEQEAEDFLFIVACCAVTAWWIIIGICDAMWLQGVVGILMIFITAPAALLFAVVWKLRSMGHRRAGARESSGPVQSDVAAVKTRIAEINRRLAILRTAPRAGPAS